MPTDNYSYRLQATYSEPLFRGAFLQLRYSFRYSYSKSDRSTYDFSDIGAGFFDGVTPQYRGWGDYLTLLPNKLDAYLDNDLSRYSEYSNYIHEVNLTFRKPCETCAFHNNSFVFIEASLYPRRLFSLRLVENDVPHGALAVMEPP